MMTVLLIVVGGLFFAALVAAGWWVRRMSSDMDYPEARGSGLSPEASEAIRLGTSLASSSAVLGGH